MSTINEEINESIKFWEKNLKKLKLNTYFSDIMLRYSILKDYQTAIFYQNVIEQVQNDCSVKYDIKFGFYLYAYLDILVQVRHILNDIAIGAFDKQKDRNVHTLESAKNMELPYIDILKTAFEKCAEEFDKFYTISNGNGQVKTVLTSDGSIIYTNKYI